MGAAVVDDQAQRMFRRGHTVDLRVELAAGRCAMAPSDPAAHVAGCDVKGGMQIRGPVPLVGVPVARDLTGPQRKHGMGPVEPAAIRRNLLM